MVHDVVATRRRERAWLGRQCRTPRVEELLSDLRSQEFRRAPLQELVRRRAERRGWVAATAERPVHCCDGRLASQSVRVSSSAQRHYPHTAQRKRQVSRGTVEGLFHAHNDPVRQLLSHATRRGTFFRAVWQVLFEPRSAPPPVRDAVSRVARSLRPCRRLSRHLSWSPAVAPPPQLLRHPCARRRTCSRGRGAAPARRPPCGRCTAPTAPP